MNNTKNILLILILLNILNSCRLHYEINWYNSSDVELINSYRAQQMDIAFKKMIIEHKINTIGVGIIKNGELAWEGYYGQQSKGVVANEKTLFNVASITKTVATETLLRLVADGRLSLDEPMSKYWIDPDLINDPRHLLLTPRMVLNHTTGFLNWRFFSDDGRLKLINDPGTTFGYSGEGFEYLVKFVEKKLNQPFHTLVQEKVFQPLGMTDTAITVQKSLFSKIAQPLSDAGEFYGYYCRPEGWCRPEGSLSTADDMVTTVQDYAKFLKSAMNGDGLNKSLIKQRKRIAQDLAEQYQYDCSLNPHAECPSSHGYGLGWYVNEPDGNQLIGHGGSDWSEMTQAYFYSGSQDGIIIFINAPSKQAIKGMIAALKIIDPKSALLHQYNDWLMKKTP